MLNLGISRLEMPRKRRMMLRGFVVMFLCSRRSRSVVVAREVEMLLCHSELASSSHYL